MVHVYGMMGSSKITDMTRWTWEASNLSPEVTMMKNPLHINLLIYSEIATSIYVSRCINEGWVDQMSRHVNWCWPCFSWKSQAIEVLKDLTRYMYANEAWQQWGTILNTLFIICNLMLQPALTNSTDLLVAVGDQPRTPKVFNEMQIMNWNELELERKRTFVLVNLAMFSDTLIN